MGEAEAMDDKRPTIAVWSDDPWRGNRALGIAILLMIAASAIAAVIGFTNERAPPGTENDVQELGGFTGWTALVVMVATFFLGWKYTAVPLLRWNRILSLFRVDIHNWISIGVLGFALFHTFELMSLGDFRGWLSGWIATVLMFGLFITGWWRVPLVRAWGRPLWRIIHWELAVGAVAFSVAHWIGIELAAGGF